MNHELCAFQLFFSNFKKLFNILFHLQYFFLLVIFSVQRAFTKREKPIQYFLGIVKKFSCFLLQLFQHCSLDSFNSSFPHLFLWNDLWNCKSALLSIVLKYPANCERLLKKFFFHWGYLKVLLRIERGKPSRADQNSKACLFVGVLFSHFNWRTLSTWIL